MRSLSQMIFGILLLASVASAAAPPIVVVSGSQPEYSMAAGISVLEDPQGTLTWQEVLAPERLAAFRTIEGNSPSFGFSRSVYWLRFSIQNPDPVAKQLNLEIAHPVLDHLTLISLDEDSPDRERQAGDHLPFAAREINYRTFVFPLSIPNHSTRAFLVRVQSTSSISMPLRLWSDEGFQEYRAKELGIFGLYYGAMIGIVLYNLFLFVSTREIGYLIYIGFVSAFILVVMTSNGLSFQYLWPTSAYLPSVAPALFTSVSVSLALLFSRNFLGMSRIRMGRLFHRLAILFAGNAFASLLLPAAVSFPFTIVTSLPTCFLVLATSFWQLFAGNRSARYYCASWTLLILGAVTYFISKVGIIPTNSMTTYGLQIGSLLEALLLSLGLADKFNAMKKEQLRSHATIVEGYEKITRLKGQLDTILAGTKELAGFKGAVSAAARAAEYIARENSKFAQAEARFWEPVIVGAKPRCFQVLQAGRALGQSFEISDSDPPTDRVRSFAPAEGKLILPLCWADECLGYLVFSRISSSMVNDEDIHFAENLSQSLASALTHINYRNHLEQLVTERTQKLQSALSTVTQKSSKIQTIMDHIQQGILTFDSSLFIDDEFSLFLGQLYRGRQAHFSGANVLATLFAEASLTADQMNHMEQTLHSVLGESALAWELNRHGLIREIEVKLDDEYRTLALDWAPIFTRSETIERIMLAIRDITAERKLEREILAQRSENRRTLEAIGDMIPWDRPRLHHLFLEMERRLATIESAPADDAANAQVARDLHTIKAQARSVDFKSIADLAHGSEECLKESGDVRIEALAQEIRFYNGVFLRVLGGPKEEATWNLQIFAGRTLPMIIRACNEAGLSLHAFDCRDEVLVWNSALANSLTDMLNHVINNAIDHGFVLPALAGRRVAEPTLTLSSSIRSSQAIIKLRDNGAGLDLTKISQLALSRTTDPHILRNPLEILFQDGTTTADAVTVSSGRGMGLAAVRAEARRQGGDVSIANHPDGGSVFTISLPLPSESLKLKADIPA